MRVSLPQTNNLGRRACICNAMHIVFMTSSSMRGKQVMFVVVHAPSFTNSCKYTEGTYTHMLHVKTDTSFMSLSHMIHHAGLNNFVIHPN